MENLNDIIKNRYAFLDSSILTHGQSYFITASKIYENLESENLYPLLTLLGFSAELFLKAFHIDLNEEYVDLGNGVSSLASKTVKTLNKNGHKLKELLHHYQEKDKELFDYLITQYKTKTDRDLETDILKYSKIFEDSRYIFESNENSKYINEIDIIFNLVKTFYDSISNLYQD